MVDKRNINAKKKCLRKTQTSNRSAPKLPTRATYAYTKTQPDYIMMKEMEKARRWHYQQYVQLTKKMVSELR